MGIVQIVETIFGGNIAAWVRTVTDAPGINPGPDATPTFDPMFGFKNGRKERGKILDGFWGDMSKSLICAC